MDLKATILTAPSLRNESCSNRVNTSLFQQTGASDVIQAFFIMTLTLAIVGANLVLIIVINCRRYSSFIHPQVSTVSVIFKWMLLSLFIIIAHLLRIFFPHNIFYIITYFTAKVFDNIISVKRFSNRSFNNTFRYSTCLVTLLALW